MTKDLLVAIDVALGSSPRTLPVVATVEQSVPASGVAEREVQKAKVYSEWASSERITDTPSPLTTYDCGILLIPDEEFDLEQRIIGRRSGVSGKRVGGLPIDTSPEAIEQARLGVRAARAFLSLASVQERAKALEQLQLNHFLSDLSGKSLPTLHLFDSAALHRQKMPMIKPDATEAAQAARVQALVTPGSDELTAFLAAHSERTRSFISVSAGSHADTPAQGTVQPKNEAVATPLTPGIAAREPSRLNVVHRASAACSATPKLLQNLSVRKVLIQAQMKLHEHDTADTLLAPVDLILDDHNAVILLKSVLLPATVSELREQIAFSDGDGTASPLLRAIRSGLIQCYHVIIEQYTASGHPMPETAPVRKAKATLQDLSFGSVELHLMSSASASMTADLIHDIIDRLTAASSLDASH